MTVRAGLNIMGTIQIENYEVSDNKLQYNVKDHVIWTGRRQGKIGGGDRITVEANQQLVH